MLDVCGIDNLWDMSGPGVVAEFFQTSKAVCSPRHTGISYFAV